MTNDLNDAYTRMEALGQCYAVVGNHDSSPVNSFPPAAVDTTITTQWAYDTLSSDWTTWIGAAIAAEADDNYGSYSVLTPGGLRIISVNTNFWYKVCLALFWKGQISYISLIPNWQRVDIIAEDLLGWARSLSRV